MNLIDIGTLLNQIFGTEFAILDPTKGRMQITKGIWIGKSKQGDILIFDIEGADSKERGE